MKFNVNQQDLQQALNYCQGVIEKRSTLPILSNILIDANNSNLIITATDLAVLSAITEPTRRTRARLMSLTNSSI